MAETAEMTRGWTRREKLQVRHLYIVRGLSPKEIAEKMEKTPGAISSLACREGWAAIRREAEEKAAAEADAKAIADVKSRAVEFAESVATRAELLTEAGFDLAEGAAAAGDAKEFAFAASGTAKFVSLTRQALGMDAQASLASINLNLVVAPPSENRPEKCVQKVDTESERETLDF
jgi:hypothetical protein